MPRSATTWLLIAALLGALAVSCGAFGAHGLRAHFEKDGAITQDDERGLASWETAARYQMYHALALLAVGILASRGSGRLLNAAGLAMTAGTLIFSGCLYALVLTGQRVLGAIVPIGGSLLILGWILLAAAAWTAPSPRQKDRATEETWH